MDRELATRSFFAHGALRACSGRGSRTSQSRQREQEREHIRFSQNIPSAVRAGTLGTHSTYHRRELRQFLVFRHRRSTMWWRESLDLGDGRQVQGSLLANHFPSRALVFLERLARLRREQEER